LETIVKLRTSCGILVVSLLIASGDGGTSAQPADTLQITLNQVFGKAVFSSCQLTITIFDGAGGSSMKCNRLPGPVPTTEIAHDRALKAYEVTQLLRLSRASNFFVGDHVGSDTTAHDGVFETLKVTESKRTVVLVSSGNKTFTTDTRRELLALLYSILNDLRKGAKQG
jgi:hypothetical protein